MTRLRELNVESRSVALNVAEVNVENVEGLQCPIPPVYAFLGASFQGRIKQRVLEFLGMKEGRYW